MNNIINSTNVNQQNNHPIWNEKFSNEVQKMKELGRIVTTKLVASRFQAIDSSIMIQAALFYVSKGWYVIPIYGIREDGRCACGQISCAAGKHPKIGNWQNEATRDVTKINSWFSQKFTNIAIVTGKKSGLIVVDLDARNGGAETMQQWESKHGKLPDTPIVHTGSSIDSYHLYFNYPEMGFPTKSDFLKGVDIKSDGGYVVASPSLHKSGRQYRCDAVLHPQKISLADVPWHFLNQTSQNRENDFKSSGGSHPKPPKAPLYVHNRNESQISGIKTEDARIKTGSRNEHTFELARHLWTNVGLSQKSIEAALCAHRDKNYDAGFTDAEIQNCVQSACSGKYGAQSKRFLSAQTTHWGELHDLPVLVPEIENITPDMIPEPWRDWITSNCAELQVPLEMMFIPALAALSGLIGRRVGMCPKSKSAWMIVVNLWCMVVAPSSMKKTPALKKALEFVIDIEKEKQKKNAEIMGEYQSKLRAYERVQKQKNVNCGEEPQKPKEDRLYISDITTEKIGMVANENPNGLIYFRDELEGHFKEFEMPGRESSRTSFLEYYNGDGFTPIDRVSRESIAPTTSIAIVGGFTTDRYKEIFARMLSSGSGGDGLLPRYQLAICPTKLKTFTFIDAEPITDAHNRVKEIFMRINNQNFSDPTLGLEISKSSHIPVTRCDDEGQKVLNDWLIRHGNNMLHVDETETPLLVSHFGKNDKLVIALALILHFINYFDLQNQNEKKSLKVSRDAVESAIQLRDYLEKHARKLYGEGVQCSVILAHKVVEKIKEGTVYDGMPTAEFHKKGWSKLKTEVDTKPVFDVLQKHNHIFIETVQTGGRPSEVIRINPDLRSKNVDH